MKTRFPFYALGFLFLGAGFLAGCVTGKSPVGAAPRRVAAPQLRPAGERTCPTLLLGPEGVELDLYDLLGGPLESPECLWTFAAEALTPEWSVTADGPAAARAPRPAPLLLWEEGAARHRLRILPPPEGAWPDSLWFARLRMRADAELKELDIALALRPLEQKRDKERTAYTIHPLPCRFDPRLSDADGAFWLEGLEPGAEPDLASLRALFGNEPVAARPGEASGGEAPAPRVEPLGGGAFVLRGLRDLAASRASDAPLRLFLRAPSGEWIEGVFPFGGRARRLFDPRDAVFYLALTDRLGAEENQIPAADADPAALDQWLGGGARGVRERVQSGYFEPLGVSCLILSPPYKQADDLWPLPGGETGARRPAAYRGVWPGDFAAPDPRMGSFEEWQKTLRAAHARGLSVILGFCPGWAHETSPLIAEKPDWFTTGSLQATPPPASAPAAEDFRVERPDRAEWEAAFLRRARFAADPIGIERMSGYGLWWLRTLYADGLHCYGTETLPPVFWRRLARRIRGEVAIPEQRGAFLLGERVWPEGPESLETVESGALAWSPLDGRVDWELSSAARRIAGAGEGSLLDLDRQARAAAAPGNAGAIAVAFSGSPDLARLAALERAGGGKGSADLALLALFTLPATPGLYSGDEILLDGDCAPETRRPLPPRKFWSEAQRARAARLGALAALRRESPALRRGGYQTLAADADRLVFARVAWSEAIVVALRRPGAPAENGAGEALEFALPPNLREAKIALPLWTTGGQARCAIESGRLALHLDPGAGGLWRLE